MFLDFDGAWGVCLVGLVFVFQYFFPEDIVFDSFEFNGLSAIGRDGVENQGARNQHDDGGIAVTFDLSFKVGGELVIVTGDIGATPIHEVIVAISVAGVHLVMEKTLILMVKQVQVNGSVISRRVRMG